jgi:hypothetical protein
MSNRLFFLLPCIFFFLVPSLSNARTVECNVGYPYISDVTKDGQEFWTSAYIGLVGASGSCFFPLPNHFEFGTGVAYALAGIRRSFGDIFFHRTSLQAKIVYDVDRFPGMSVRPFIGADAALLHWSGPEASYLSKENEYGLGLMIGASWLFAISKTLQLGPALSFTYHRRFVKDTVSPSLTCLQTGMTLAIK